MKTLEAEQCARKLLSIERVIVAVDLTKHSVATTHYAAEIAQCFNATLYLTHVFTSELFSEFGSEASYKIMEEQKQELRAKLDALAEQVQKLVPLCESVFLEGDPAEQVATLARDIDADLIVTASHHPSFLGRLFNLDKAPQIMHRAPCPVLVYHEKKSLSLPFEPATNANTAGKTMVEEGELSR
jgi:nucleotide-binding universal stress UspA family protein